MYVLLCIVLWFRFKCGSGGSDYVNMSGFLVPTFCIGVYFMWWHVSCKQKQVSTWRWDSGL